MQPAVSSGAVQRERERCRKRESVRERHGERYMERETVRERDSERGRDTERKRERDKHNAELQRKPPPANQSNILYT